VPAESQKLLDDFADEMERAWQAGRSAIREESRETAGWPNRTVENRSNKQAVLERQDAIRAAQKMAREDLWMLADVSPGAIVVKLAELRATIPFRDTIPTELPLRLNSTVKGGIATKASEAPASVYDKRGLDVIQTPVQSVGQVN